MNNQEKNPHVAITKEFPVEHSAQDNCFWATIHVNSVINALALWKANTIIPGHIRGDFVIVKRKTNFLPIDHVIKFHEWQTPRSSTRARAKKYLQIFYIMFSHLSRVRRYLSVGDRAPLHGHSTVWFLTNVVRWSEDTKHSAIVGMYLQLDNVVQSTTTCSAIT